MANSKVEGLDLKKLIKMGKKRAMNFAYVPGDKADQTLMVDKRIKPPILGKTAKKETGATRFAFGTFEVQGKTMVLTCEKVVPNMAKQLKKYLKTQKIPLNVEILDENGNPLESDIEDLPDDPEFDRPEPDGEEQAPEAPVRQDAEPGPTPADLAARLKQVQPALAAAQGDAAAKLKRAAAAAIAQIKAGDIAGAETTLTLLEEAAAKLAARSAQPAQEDVSAADTTADAQALTDRADKLRQAVTGLPDAAAAKLGAALATAERLLGEGKLDVAAATLEKIEAAAARVADAPPPGARKWAAAEARLQPAIDKAMTERRGDLDAINRAMAFARDKAAAGDHDAALKAAARVAELLKQASAMQTTAAAQEAADTVPDDVVPFVQSRLDWGRTRQGLRSEMQTLKSEIEAATAGLDGLDDVPASTQVLFDELDRIDSSLEDALDALAQTADGPEREALRAQAVKIVGSYRDVLDTPFFQAVDDNGFARTNIRGAALSALQQVSDVLAA